MFSSAVLVRGIFDEIYCFSFACALPSYQVNHFCHREWNQIGFLLLPSSSTDVEKESL